MEDYLIDRETLGKFVDGLIKQKALAVNSPEELNKLREAGIRELDDEIGVAIFSQLTKEQAEEYDKLLDSDEENPDVFREFFANAGIDVEEAMSEAMKAFGVRFLGGENA